MHCLNFCFGMTSCDIPPRVLQLHGVTLLNLDPRSTIQVVLLWLIDFRHRARGYFTLFLMQVTVHSCIPLYWWSCCVQSLQTDVLEIHLQVHPEHRKHDHCMVVQFSIGLGSVIRPQPPRQYSIEVDLTTNHSSNFGTTFIQNNTGSKTQSGRCTSALWIDTCMVSHIGHTSNTNKR